MDIICDKCGEEIEAGYANDGPPGEYEGATLCNGCYAEVANE